MVFKSLIETSPSSVFLHHFLQAKVIFFIIFFIFLEKRIGQNNMINKYSLQFGVGLSVQIISLLFQCQTLSPKSNLLLLKEGMILINRIKEMIE